MFALSACAQQPSPETTRGDTLEARSVHVRYVDHRGNAGRIHFVRFGQCQFRILLDSILSSDGLNRLASADAQQRRIRDCLTVADAEAVDVLVLPELSLAVNDVDRAKFIDEIAKSSIDRSRIVIAGSFYDNRRYSRLAVIGPGWQELGYKVRPSRFEVSPKAGEGMEPADEVLVLKTPQGTFAIITCVDLISDEVQHTLRVLATRGDIDGIININYNPAGLEFLAEANSIARRHPVFISITNVTHPGASCGNRPESSGYCHGNSAIFASLRSNPEDAPNSIVRILDLLPPYLVQSPNGKQKERLVPYDTVVGALGALDEAVLVYDLNMFLVREPLATNAPDQGYPPLRGLKIVRLPTRTPAP
jgi:predicted amidohydrolase